MTELSPKARALLTRTASGFAPRAADRDRIRDALHARIGAAAAAGGIAALAGGVASRSAGSHGLRSVFAKLGQGTTLGRVVVSSIVVSAVALTFALRRQDAAPDVPTAAPVAMASAVAPLASFPAPAPDERADIPLVDVTALPSARPRTRRVPHLSSTTVQSGSLEDEIALLRDAQAATRTYDDARALALLEAHARRFPSGVLAEERDAARIFALCSLGRAAEATKARTVFLAAHPSSPHTPRVREACVSE